MHALGVIGVGLFEANDSAEAVSEVFSFIDSLLATKLVTRFAKSPSARLRFESSLPFATVILGDVLFFKAPEREAASPKAEEGNPLVLLGALDDASRLVDATHTVRQRLAFVMRSATDPMLREAAKYVLGGNVTSPNVRNETESSEIKYPLHTGQPDTQQPGQATSTLLRKKLPAQDYSQLVLVDALVHENYAEVASQFREIEHEVGGTLILVLLTEPRPAEGLGMRLLPELNISVEEGYRAGYDLVLPKHFDHTVALFLTELFLSASGRWQKLTSQAAASGMANYNRIRYVLGDVADWKTPPLKGEAPSPNNTSAIIPKGGGALLSSSTQSMTTKNDIATSLKAPSVVSLTRAQHQESLLLSQIQKQKEQIKLLIRFIHTNYLSSQQQQQQQPRHDRCDSWVLTIERVSVLLLKKRHKISSRRRCCKRPLSDRTASSNRWRSVGATRVGGAVGILSLLVFSFRSKRYDDPNKCLCCIFFSSSIIMITRMRTHTNREACT